MAVIEAQIFCTKWWLIIKIDCESPTVYYFLKAHRDKEIQLVDIWSYSIILWNLKRAGNKQPNDTFGTEYKMD